MMTQMQYFRWLSENDPDIIEYSKDILKQYPEMVNYGVVSDIAWQMIGLYDDCKSVSVDRGIEMCADSYCCSVEELLEAACEQPVNNADKYIDLTEERIATGDYVLDGYSKEDLLALFDEFIEDLEHKPIRIKTEKMERVNQMNDLIRKLGALGTEQNGVKVTEISLDSGCATFKFRSIASFFDGTAKNVFLKLVELADMVSVSRDVFHESASISFFIRHLYED